MNERIPIDALYFALREGADAYWGCLKGKALANSAVDACARAAVDAANREASAGRLPLRIRSFKGIPGERPPKPPSKITGALRWGPVCAGVEMGFGGWVVVADVKQIREHGGSIANEAAAFREFTALAAIRLEQAESSGSADPVFR